MDKIRIRKLISSLAKRDYRRMYMNDFFLTWEKTDDEIAATFLVAEILRGLREANISCRGGHFGAQDAAFFQITVLERGNDDLFHHIEAADEV